MVLDTVASELEQRLTGELGVQELPEILVQTVETAGKQLADWCEGQQITAGTPLVMGLLWKEKLYFCSVGDSRIYLCRGDETSWPDSGMQKLRDMGFKTAAMALSDDSVSIRSKDLMAEEKLAIILGTEGDGLATSTIDGCDYTVCIPMSHGVDSLNVAAASAVAFWQLGKR